ncbi:MAG: hypothetical protein IT493_07920 [Gammaproteobacteria bacterium]|nr:hypothetical protein [Gammaproteobacteria bacterium]
MLLSRLQSQLADFYAAPIPYDVYDFLITDRDTAAALTPSGAPTGNRERLLVRDGEDLELSLFIDAALLAALDVDDPIVSLHEGNLADFLVAVEGVSHLQYLIFRAGLQQPVSLLELELQAEVDKYVTSAELLSSQCDNRHIPSALHARLFEDVSFDASLPPAAQLRYVAANRLAARYCHALRRRYPGHHHQKSFVRDLRDFYRMSEGRKVRHIMTLD